MISDVAMTVALDTGFQKRVRYFMVKAAIAILAEGQVANHYNREVLAKKILIGDQLIEPFSISVMTNSTIASEANSSNTPDFSIPDGDLEFMVNSVVTTLAF